MRRMAKDLHEFPPAFQAMLDASPDGVLVVDRKGLIVALNHQAAALFGTTQPKLHGRPVESLIPARFRRTHAADRLGYTDAPTVRPMSARHGLTGLRVDGTEFPVEISLTPVLGSSDGLTMAVVHDVSSRIDLESALARSERVTNALDAVPEAVITTDLAGNVEFLNRGAEELTGLSRAAAHGRAVSDVLPVIGEADDQPLIRLVTRCLENGSPIAALEGVLSSSKGHASRTLDVSATPVRGPSGDIIGAAIVARDVTHSRLIAKQLSHQAAHDALTGLVNRSEFERRLAHSIASADSDRFEHAICFLDLDGFKQVNDACGHLAGDELLRQLSEVLSERMRSRDTLARLGGDEFGILLEHCKLPRARRIAEAVRKAIAAHRFSCERQTYGVGVSIGITPIRADSGSPTDILHEADTACYLAKRAGGNRVHVFDPRRQVTGSAEDDDWEMRIRCAVEDNRFRLYAQPIVALNRLNGLGPSIELLLRLEEGESEPLLPAAFLPTAERSGLMPTVDGWVIRRAVHSLSAWLRAHPGAECPTVAINLSRATVADPDVVRLVRRELVDSGLPPRALCFEVSESVVTSQPVACTRLFRELRDAGCQTTLDQTGSGMTAFTSLGRLQLDYIKIAGHIVRDLPSDPVDHVLATALNQVSHLRNIRTIGFGAESRETLNCLRRLRVDFAQGYCVAPPEPFEIVLDAEAVRP
jgi:diguanylate cyclase (GGDEF)-like protein/PAS domain S-box-containing protein